MKTLKHDPIVVTAVEKAWPAGCAFETVKGAETMPPAIANPMVMSPAIRPQPNRRVADPRDSRQLSLIPSMGPKPSKMAMLTKTRRIAR
jgi:hypothetical protein